MTNVLITGTNAGIGRGFVEEYLGRPNTTVIATVRDPDSAGAKSLQDITKADGSKLIVVKVESKSDTDALEAVASLGKENIKHLDIVIANAGYAKFEAYVEVSKMNSADLLDHVNVNTAGPIRLFQATLPLLQAAKQPKFIVISSAVGTIGAAERITLPITSYGASKAAVNFVLRHIHFENPDLIAISLHPGAVQTVQGDAGCRFFGMDGAPTTVKESIDGMVAKIDEATREETSGKFLSFDDTPMLW